MSQQVVQDTKLPDGAFERLEELLGMLSDGQGLELKSAQQAVNLYWIQEIYPTLRVDEVWCTVWMSDDYTWGLGVYRQGDEWVDAFNAFMFPTGQARVDQLEVWANIGCENFVDPTFTLARPSPFAGV